MNVGVVWMAQKKREIGGKLSLHDNIYDSLVEYDCIFHMFGARVADLMEELRVPLLMDFDHCFRVVRIMSLVISTFIFFGILKLLAGCTAINVI
ncbi:hypothetical protein ZWY2020_011281 [Hordeum vulgare]|nr:hypothetical protein ZWY2020_011281 [Hordeum vulgare]